jgi:hypothetical protein
MGVFVRVIGDQNFRKEGFLKKIENKFSEKLEKLNFI